ncbi:MAG TPA: hypothetical protein VKM72_32600 [Thermoanaerobaculia bacterium]|nr:hypothetical protein [Thermoanaerobaculia bacterium]
MKPFKLLAMLLALTLPLGIACKGQEQAEVDDPDDTATTVTEQEIPGVNSPGDLNPVEAQTMIDDVTIGHKVTPEGTIAAEDQGDDFAPGETVNITMEVGDVPAGSAVKVVWYGPGETRINDEQKTVEAGASYLAFQTDTASWQKGDYRAEVWIGDEKVNTQQFQIVDADKAGR